MENNIDKLFKSKLESDQVPYDPAAWGRMAALIDEDSDLNGNILPARKKGWKTYLGLALLLIISLVGFWQFNKLGESNLAMKTSTSNEKEAWSSINSTNKSIDLKAYETPDIIPVVDKNSVNDSKNKASVAVDGSLKDTQNKTLENQNNENEKSSILKSIDIDRNSSNEKIAITDYLPNDDILNDAKVNSKIGDNTIKNATNYDIESKEPNEIQSDNNISNSLKATTLEINNNDVSNEVLNEVNTSKSNEYIELLKNDKIAEKDILSTNLREDILMFPFLNTSTSELENDDKQIIPLIVEINNNDRYQLGLYSNLAINNGYISQSGLNIDYRLKNGWSVMAGLGFEFSNYNNGAKIAVEDKLYSFGSTLVTRTMTMNKRTAMALPIQVKKSLGALSVFGGITLNYHIATNGIIDNGELGDQSVWVSNDVFRPLTLSYQIGTSYFVSRRLEFNAGLMYRTSEISNSVTAQNSGSRIYPSFGFNYLITKN